MDIPIKQTKKILLVDDSQTQLKSLSLILSKSGYDVVTATNGVEGIQAAYECMPDLIVSDIIMPDIDGYQLCRLLKNDSFTKNIPIILLTNLNERMDKFWGLRSGADSFINKFGEINSLINEIERNITLKKNAEKASGKANKKRITNETDIHLKIKNIIDQSLIESTIINEFRTLSELVSNNEDLNRGIFSTISSILDYHVAGIFFNDRDEKKPKKVYFSLCDVFLPPENLKQISEDFFNSIYPAEVSPSGNDLITYELFESHCSLPKSITDNHNFQSRLIIPLLYEEKVIGGICLYHVDPGKYAPSANAMVKIIDIVIQEMKVLMKIKWLYSETKYLAITDGLTGLYNRRYFQQFFEREFERARRLKGNLSVLMIDIDFFKKVNDTYGHQFGDKVIMEIARIVKESFRRVDYIARYGGEEIVAILPDTSIQNSLIPVERMRTRIEATRFVYKENDVKITVSAGIAAYSVDMKTEKELLENADKALYVAKESGRNRVEIYKP